MVDVSQLGRVRRGAFGINVGDIADTIERIASRTPGGLDYATAQFIELSVTAGTRTQQGIAGDIAAKLESRLRAAQASAWRA